MSASRKARPAKQKGDLDISLLRPELQSQWDHESNQHITGVIRTYSERKVSWLCDQCPEGCLHKWEATVLNRTTHTDCPFCVGKKVCPHNSLAQKAVHIAKDWDPEKNCKSPHDYTSGSEYRAHWKCQHGHEWQVRIASRVKNGTGCPVCAMPSKQPVVASNDRIMQLWGWERNTQDSLDPEQLTCGSTKRVHLICDKCPKQQPHKWRAIVRNVQKNGSGCPYCSSKRVCKCNSVRTLRPDCAADWCYAKNVLTPDDYTSRSRVKVWWQNKRRGIWKASLGLRTRETRAPGA